MKVEQPSLVGFCLSTCILFWLADPIPEDFSMRCCLFLFFLLWSPISIQAQLRSPTNSEVVSAVDRSISWLENDMSEWRSNRKCAACHHGPMYLWSMHVAKNQGYEVEEFQLTDMTNWMLMQPDSRMFPKEPSPLEDASSIQSVPDRMTSAMMGHQNLSQPTLYLTHALNAMKSDRELAKVGWDKTLKHLSAAQLSDGSFSGRDAWRPIFNTPQILTRFVVASLQNADYPHDARTKILMAANTFLEHEQPDDTQQGIVLRILGIPSDRVENADRCMATELLAKLQSLQRPDGGWSQTDDRDSDAFATGQALVAMHYIGRPVDDPQVAQAIQFLCETQAANGTWQMTSRPNPENGKPAELLNPITYAATAWACMGLANYVPHPAGKKTGSIP